LEGKVKRAVEGGGTYGDEVILHIDPEQHKMMVKARMSFLMDRPEQIGKTGHTAGTQSSKISPANEGT